MAERRQFEQSAGAFDPGALFPAGADPNSYGGALRLPGQQQKRQLTAEEDDDAPLLQRYVPPATMDILLADLAKQQR